MKTLIIFLFFLDVQAKVFSESVSTEFGQEEKKFTLADHQALDSYSKALTPLLGLYQKTKNPVDKEELLVRIINTQYKIANLAFLILGSHQKNINQREITDFYSHKLLNIVQQTTLYLKNYPQYASAERMLYIRATAEKEIGDFEHSIQDLKTIIDQAKKETVEFRDAKNKLYELLIDKKDYQTAYIYHTKKPTRPNSPDYLTYLEHLGLLEYYLNQIPQAIEHNQQAFHLLKQDSQSKAHTLNSKDRLNHNLALFFYRGMELNLPQFNSDNAIHFFKAELPKEALSSVVNHFLIFLRSKGKLEQIESFKEQALHENLETHDLLNLLLNVLNIEISQHQILNIRKTVAYVEDLFKKNPNLQNSLEIKTESIDPAEKSVGEAQVNFKKARDNLLESSKRLQEYFNILLKNSSANTFPVAITLIDLLRLISKIQTSIEKKAETQMVSAEIADQTRNYSYAIEIYKNILKSKIFSGEIALQVKKKLVLTYYKYIQSKNMIPKNLILLKTGEITSNPAPSPTLILDWIALIDELSLQPKIAPTDLKALNLLQVDAGKILYSQKQVSLAFAKWLSFIKQYPQEKQSILLGSFMLDHDLTQHLWQERLKLTQDLIKILAPTEKELRPKLPAIASQCSFEIVQALYQKKDYVNFLAQADPLLANPNFLKKSDLSILAGNAALEVGQKTKAIEFFNQASKLSGKEELKTFGQLESASLQEENGHWAQAAQDYLELLKTLNQVERNTKKSSDSKPQVAVEPAEIPAIQKKALLYAYVSGNQNLLNTALVQICSDSLQASGDCETFMAYREAQNQGIDQPKDFISKKLTQAQIQFFYKKMKTASPTLRALWATLLLPEATQMDLDREREILKIFAQSINQSPNLIRLSLLEKALESLPGNFEDLQRKILQKNTLRLDPQSITAKMQDLKNLEDFYTPWTQLSWIKLRALGLVFLMSAQDCMIQAFEKAAPPADQLSPEEKTELLSTLKGLEDPLKHKMLAFENQLRELLKTHPLLAVIHPWVQAWFKGPWPVTTPVAFQRELLEPCGVDFPQKKTFLEALEQRHFAQAAFMIEKGLTPEKKPLNPFTRNFLKAAVLFEASAEPEAFDVINDFLKSNPTAPTPACLGIFQATKIQAYFRLPAFNEALEGFENLQSLELVNDLTKKELLDALSKYTPDQLQKVPSSIQSQLGFQKQ